MTNLQHGFAPDSKLCRCSSSGEPAGENAQQLLTELGSVVIIAPHPDDETLGCGGFVAACAELDIPLTILAITNGEGSHPQSRQWSKQRLARERCKEQLRALQVLGLASPPVLRLNLPDGQVSQQPAHVLENARFELCRLARQSSRTSVFVTSPDDDHPDHRACAALVAAVAEQITDLQVFHYSVWPAAILLNTDTKKADSGPWLLDIRPAWQRKASAIACHRSQRGLLIDDDPAGFCMPASLLQRALAAHETFDSSW